MTTVGAVLQSIVSGKSLQTMERPAQCGEYGILKVSAVTWGEFRPGQNKAMPEDYEPGECPRPMDGDILISRANTRELVGAPVLVRGDHPQLLLSDKILKLIPDRSRVDHKYLVRALRFPAATAHFYKCAGGSSGSMTNITQGDIRSAPIPLPPLEEQRRIAAILDQAETLRTQRRAALAQLDSLTQSIFLDMFGDPRENPKRWKLSPVGDYSDCIVPGRDKPKSFTGDVPWITTANLNHLGKTIGPNGGLALSRSEIAEVRAKVIPAGSVVISCVGDLGIISVAGVPMVINQQLHSFQCHAELNSVFLMHCLAFQKAFMLAKASSTTLPYMNKTVCNSIPVIVPPLPLQQTFATRIQAIESLKATHRAALTALDALFASLQQRAFTGELTQSVAVAMPAVHNKACDFSELCRLDAEKGLEALIYVAKRMPQHDMYKSLKALYFGDKHHLECHGALIYGETYSALPHGPVPQFAYDLTKGLEAAATGDLFAGEVLPVALRLEGTQLIPTRDADTSKLSAAERQSLDWAIKYCGNMSFEQTKTASHDSAYKATMPNTAMAMEAIIRMLPEELQRRFFD